MTEPKTFMQAAYVLRTGGFFYIHDRNKIQLMQKEKII